MSDVVVEPDRASPLFNRLLGALRPEILQSLSETQRDGLREAFASTTWRRQSVDIRLSLPFLSSRFFLTIVAGRERRFTGRRHAERVFHPLGTVGNVLFAGAIGLVLFVVAAAAVLVYSAILTS